jgi:hypothetical protein
MEQSLIAVSIMPPIERLIPTNPASQQAQAIKYSTVDAALEKYNLLEDEQAHKLTLRALVEEPFTGEGAVLPLIISKRGAQKRPSDIGASL